MKVDIPQGARTIPTDSSRMKPHVMLHRVELKLCPRCDMWLPLSEFWAHWAHWDGLQCNCKTCVNEQIEAWKKSNKR